MTNVSLITDSDNNNSGNISPQSDSPARTIESHDSTTGSLDTIVDRSLNVAEVMLQQHQALAHSVNTTNEQTLHHQQRGSLNNSQISMIQHNTSDDDQQLRQLLQQQQQHTAQQAMPQQMHQQQSQHQQLDAQSHIYSSPVYAINPDQKPPLKLTAASILESVEDAKKPKLMSHEEFQQQLQAAAASRANTLDSRISKKQRFPPEFIRIKDGEKLDYASTLQSKDQRELQRQLEQRKRPKPTGPPFPAQIALGLVQLLLAITLVALGSLLLVRNASLATAGCGIWAGSIAAITGSLGVVSMRKTQSAFLALSLICIATSTLAMAISGVGLSRDINHMPEEVSLAKTDVFDLLNAKNEISAASGLIFALFLHLVVSIVSVYCCAVQICARCEANDLNDVVKKANQPGTLDQENCDQYLKTMSPSGNDKENNQKLTAMWMYATQMGLVMPPLPPYPPSLRKIKLIPATSTCGTNHLSPPPLTAAGVILPPPSSQYHSLPQGYLRTPVVPAPHGPGPLIYAPHPSTYRTQKSTKSSDLNSQRRRRRAPAAGGPASYASSRATASRRQRRKSDTDAIDGEGQAAFMYTGLDRLIADSFLARQEQSHAGSNVDCSSASSSSTASERAARPTISRAASKTMIICKDVAI